MSDELSIDANIPYGTAGSVPQVVVEATIATGRPAVSWSGMFDLLQIIEATDDLPFGNLFSVRQGPPGD